MTSNWFQIIWIISTFYGNDKWYEMIQKDLKWYKMIWNDAKWYEMIQNDMSEYELTVLTWFCNIPKILELSNFFGFQNDRNGMMTTMMMINRVNTMTPRQNDLVVKNLVFLEPKLEILKQKSSLIHVWTWKFETWWNSNSIKCARSGTSNHMGCFNTSKSYIP